MKIIDCLDVVEKVKNACIDINIHTATDLRTSMEEALEKEDFPLAKEVLSELLENQKVAEEENIPICQDTGMIVCFVELGQDVKIINGSITEAINEGVRRGYKEGYLRKSVVSCPIGRQNTQDNTPAIVHYEVVTGDAFKITLAAKGFGSENMSRLSMLKPSDGEEGIKSFILDTIKNAGASCCPPIIVGVGIGGNFEKAAYLAKKALMREINTSNKDSQINRLEKVLLNEINLLGIGPQGFGGKTTALAVHVETFPTHIAGLPVAVNINCHVSRHTEIVL